MNSLNRLRRVVLSQQSRLLPAFTTTTKTTPQQQHAWMSTSNAKKTRQKSIKGNRGSRGHGWYVKYRSGRGGRSLQGEYWDRHQHHWDPQQWNDAVLSLGSQYVYLDIAIEPPSTSTTTATTPTTTTMSASGKDEDEIIITEEGANAEEGSEESNDKNEWAAAPTSPDTAATPTPTPTTTSNTTNKDEIKVERLIIQVASTVMPETCINFIGLCQDAKYHNSILYRIEKQVGICGGDVLTNTGRTGQCWQSFPSYSQLPPRPRATTLRRDLPPPSDEPMALWHTAGVVTMLCPKVNEIDSRFLLCGQDAPHLDGIHRAFGKLEPESLQMVQNWQTSVITSYGKPKSVTLRIVGCGVLENYSSSSSSSGDSRSGGNEEEANKTQNKMAASVSSA